MPQSLILLFFNKLKKMYFNFEDMLDIILRDSLLFKFTSASLKWLQICLKESLFLVISRNELTPSVLEDSAVARTACRLYRNFEYRTMYHLEGSAVARLSRLAREEMCRFPVKTVSGVISIGILMNLSLSLILRDSVGAWSLIMSALFLAAGAIGLSCAADLETLKKGSIALKALKWFRRN